MTKTEQMLTLQLRKAQRRIRRLEVEHSISLILRDRLETLRKIADDERREKTVELNELINAIVKTIDAKDDETIGHSVRVALYSRALALELGLRKNRTEQVYRAALLHDVGKIGIPDSVLKKGTRLSDAEYEVIKSHTVIGYDILSLIKSFPYITQGAYYHHERWDGSGYPQGLKGTEIPIIGRIIAVADVFDAMCSKRRYKESYSKDDVIAYIAEKSGSHFDPMVVRAFLKCSKDSFSKLTGVA